MADDMIHIDPTPILSLAGVRPVLAALPGARIVGGAVRDVLAGRPVSDVDVATPLAPDAVTAALKRAGLRAIPTGLAHGTVTALAEGATIEITTLRRDVETDGRHAVVAFTDDFRVDAARRDFTINALSMTPDGTVFDYFGGVEDLQARRVRFVGEPAARIAEDYLRILRFFRFQARYGRKPPDDETAQALRAAAPKLATLSAERLWSETAKILSVADPRAVLRLMEALGVLAALLPEADPGWKQSFERLAAAEAPADPLLRLAALLADPARAARAAARLKLANAERDCLLALVSGPLPAVDSDAGDRWRALADTRFDVLRDRSYLRHEPGEAADAFRGFLALVDAPVFPLQGRDAVALGLEPGPALGAALRRVRAWWLERGCVDDAEACRAELARVAARPAS
jgi:poly(A) polymerase/tRNA nucleotidyltransferase (CCA-adding enzyme)